MLIYTLLLLSTSSLLYLLLRQRGSGWPAYAMMTLVAIVAWLCAIGASLIAWENNGMTMGNIPLSAMILVFGFVLYPFVLWAIARLFERGRRSK